VNLYAESCAVLAWLLGDAGGEAVRKALSAAEIVLASHLTLIECSRILIRAGATGRLSVAQVAGRDGLPAPPGIASPAAAPGDGRQQEWTYEPLFDDLSIGDPIL
jgi:hypothetical protein